MKQFCLLLLVLLTFLCGNAQIPELSWAKQFGEAECSSEAITVDRFGNTYLTGHFSGTQDFDAGKGVYNLTAVASSSDIFVAKYDVNGNFIWGRAMGGYDDDKGYAIATDTLGNVYTTGINGAYADFDPGVSPYRIDSAGTYLSKLDSAGNFVWAKRVRYGKWGFLGYCITVDDAQNVYTCVYHRDKPTDPYEDFCILKYDKAGNVVWRTSNLVSTKVVSIAIDKRGNVYTTGFFYNNYVDKVDFDPGPGVYNCPGTGGIFVLKLDNNGKFKWARSFSYSGKGPAHTVISSVASGYGNSMVDLDLRKNITVDDSGYVYTTGYLLNGQIDYDPGPDSFFFRDMPPVHGSYPFNKEMFVSKLDSSGNFVWAKEFGSIAPLPYGYISRIIPKAIGIDKVGNIHIAGNFFDTMDFDPGPGVKMLTSTSNVLFTKGLPDSMVLGNTDMFYCKLDRNGNLFWATNMGDSAGYVTDMAVSPSGHIYSTGNFHNVVDFDPGAGKYLLRAAGSKQMFVHRFRVCKMNDLQIKNACKEYFFGDTLIKKSGTYKRTFSGPEACDTLRELKLNIININDGISKSGTMLSSSESAAGALYQWVSCPSFTPVSGAVSKTYTPAHSGSFAVIVTLADCKETSACMPVIVTGIEETGIEKMISLFPNPTSGDFTVIVTNEMLGADITIVNMLGQKVMGRVLQQNASSFNLVKGFYMIKLEKEGKAVVYKLVVD
jgi:hypothetical protein